MSFEQRLSDSAFGSLVAKASTGQSSSATGRVSA